jgi:hypothetical protein
MLLLGFLASPLLIGFSVLFYKEETTIPTSYDLYGVE